MQVKQDEMTIKETEDFVFTPTGEPEQLWVLSKASGETYRVDLKDFVCSCADFRFRQAKGDRLCKHLRAASETYGVEPKPRLPAVHEEITAAITVSQQEVVEELSKELRDEMVKNYVYAVPDYEREYTDKLGRKRTVKKQGWIDLRAAGVRDLAHMVADRYGEIELGEFRFMDAQTKWLAWRDIRLGNFTATGFAECDKEKEFPFRYLGEVVMRNAYKSIVPKIYQDIFTNKFRELMRNQLEELTGAAVEDKPPEELSDGELTRALMEAQRKKRVTEEEKGGAAKAATTDTTELPGTPIFKTWGELAEAAYKLGVSSEDVFKRAKVKQWQDFASYLDAWKVVEELVNEKVEAVALAKSKAQVTKTEVTPAAGSVSKEEEGFHIDLQWLKEAKQALKWTDETMLSFIASQYKVSGKTVTEALNRLTREQAEDFTRQINAKLERQSSLF